MAIKDHAVPVSDIPECVGTGPNEPCAFKKTRNLNRFLGMDDRWRCEQCQRIHMERYFQELSNNKFAGRKQ